MHTLEGRQVKACALEKIKTVTSVCRVTPQTNMATEFSRNVLILHALAINFTFRF